MHGRIDNEGEQSKATPDVDGESPRSGVHPWFQASRPQGAAFEKQGDHGPDRQGRARRRQRDSHRRIVSGRRLLTLLIIAGGALFSLCKEDHADGERGDGSAGEDPLQAIK